MPTRVVGLLVVLTVVIAAGTLAQDLRFDSALSREHTLIQTLDREAGWSTTTVANLRAAQAGYIATGQDADYWIAQVNTISGELEAAIRRRHAAAPEATRKQYDSAATALAAFVAVDGRARSYVRAEQRLLASDLIFMESIQALARVTGALEAARTAEAAASEARVNRLRMLRVGLNGVSIAFVVAVALFFWRALMSQSSQPEPVQSIGVTPISPAPRMIPPPPPPVPAPSPAVSALPAPAPAVSAAPPLGLSLAEAAALCGDLAKVVDTRDVPPLFDRAAAVLSAKGAVLWVADSGGSMLRPSLTHGYSDRVVAKLGMLTADADNLTSLAYRSMRPQSVNGGTPESPGAIAVPLLASTGCVGVLAAETRQQQPGLDVLPVAQMIAAQFAALVAPAAPAGQKTG
jgi:hypothetical protein